jgi:hypothetical protein
MGLAVSHPRPASAQAPDEAFRLPADSEIQIGDPFLCPPEEDLAPMGGRAPVEAWVVHPTLGEDQGGNPHPGIKPALCPLLKPPHPQGYPNVHDEGTLLEADGAPMGGTFAWNFGGKTGKEAWFESAALLGMEHQVSVTYTVQGEGQDTATSGYIRVFNAELTLEGGDDGPQANEEEDPGFVIGVGLPRKALTLTLSPSNPHNLMPDNFNWGLTTRQGPPPYVVSLAPTGPVSIYAAAEGGTPLTDLVWGWEDNGPGGLTETHAPGQVYVEATGTGEATLTLGIDLNCPQECMPWYAVPTYAEDKINLTVIDPLQAWDLDGEVTEEKEEVPGAFVHYNVDNDNSSDNSQGAPKHPGGDCLETGPVAGENDLKLVKMCVGPVLTDGVVTLSRSQAGLKVWVSPTKGAGNEILVDQGTKQWDLSDENQRNQFNAVKNGLYVEGCAGGTATLTLTYAPPGDQPEVTDEVNYTFIAADCGNQPRTDNGQRQYFESRFPLVPCEWSITAQPSGDYNCIAYSVSLVDRCIYSTGNWPDPHESIDWDYGDRDGVFDYPQELDAFYADKGYFPTAPGPEDAEVMYYTYFHAARKKGCGCGAGRWLMFESKWGDKERIEHVWDQLNSIYAGVPIRFYKN